MNSIRLKHVPDAFAGLLDEYHCTQHGKDVTKTTWQELTSSDLQAVVQAVDPDLATACSVPRVSELFLPDNPDVALSYRWSATLGDVHGGLCSTCSPDETVWIDILFNGQNAELTSKSVLELTPKRYQNTRRHILVVTSTQDLVALLHRGWICFEIAVRMISDQPMVELIDPHRKATELYQCGGLQRNFFEEMETFEHTDKLLIQGAIRQLFQHSQDSHLTADPVLNFNRGVGDFVLLTGGKLLVADLADQACWQVKSHTLQFCFVLVPGLDCREVTLTVLLSNKGPFLTLNVAQRILQEGWTLSREMFDKGKFSDCLFVRERLVWAVQDIHGHEHIDMAKILHNIGSVYVEQGEYQFALAKYEESLQINEIVHGRENSDVAASYSNIGVVYQQMGEFAKALEYLNRDLEITRRVHGDEHINMATTLKNIGNVYLAQGEPGLALSKYEESLRIEEKVHGNEHIGVAKSLMNMGNVYLAQGQYGLALTKHENALRIKVKVHGNEHIDVAASLNNIGVVYETQGERGRALEHYEESFRIKVKVLGREHIDVATSLNNIGNVYCAQGEYQLALDKYEESVQIKVKVHGDEHALVALSLNNIGEVYRKQGEYQLALDKYEQSLAINRKVHGGEHIDMAATFQNLGYVYSELGKPDEALKNHEQALTIRKKILGPDHSLVADCLMGMANVWASKGGKKEALNVLEEALQIKVKVHGDEHIEVALCLNNMGYMLCKMRDYHEAHAKFQQARAIAECEGDKSPWFHTSRGGAAIAMKHLSGLTREARDMFEASVAALEALCGDGAKALIAEMTSDWNGDSGT